ncbi:MAG: flagellar hook-length control protein FliK [Armatimonadota bacterium]
MTADDQSESRSDSVEVAASRKAPVADTTTSRRINRVVQTAVTEAAQKARVGEATGDIIHERVVVKLSPPELGEVTVDIHRRQEGVRVMLQTDSIGAATHLRDNANSLQGTLRDMGLHLDHFEVACNADGGGWMPPDGRGEGRSAQALRYEGAMPPQEVEQETVAHQASRSSHTVDVIA